MRNALALLFLLSTCAAGQGQAAECASLQPGPGPFETALELGYESAVNRLFFGAERFSRDVQMVRLTPGEPFEETVYIVDKDQFNVTPGHDYELVTVRALASIIGAVMHDGPTATVPLDVRRTSIDSQLVEDLHRSWREMILRSKFPDHLDVKPLGVEFHFTAQLDVAPGSAYVEGPPNGSCPGMFADLGKQLISYARSDAKDRPSIREKLLRQSRELRARVIRPAQVSQKKAGK
jgi:hypothetical protein